MIRNINILFLVLTAGCAKPTSSQKPAPCDDFELDVERFWSSSTKVDIELSLQKQWSGELGVDVAKERVDAIATNMDRVTADWVMLRRSVCRDHFVREVGTAEQYHESAGCLDGVLVLQRTLVTQLSQGTAADTTDSALGAIEEQLNSCR